MTNNAAKRTMVIDLDGGNEPQAGAALVEESTSKNVVNADVNALDQLPECATVNADGSVTLPLMSEITFDVKKDGKVSSVRYTELTFHRLNGAAFRAIGATSEERKPAVTFARSCRIADVIMFKIFDEMDMADIANGGKVMNHFLTSGPKTPSK